MSWSVGFIGEPQKVVTALQEQSEKLEGQSKIEFDAALPHMIGLVEQNFSINGPTVIRIAANGSGYANNGNQEQRQCSVKIETFYERIV